MLVLTRKKLESISIGNDVVITITQIGSGKVKLGIEAPAHVRIRRSELVSFEMQAAVTPANESLNEAGENEAESDEPLYQETVTETPVDFTTEYAAEIEDQMRCTLAY